MKNNFYTSPRKLINLWESQALEILKDNGLDYSFKLVSELMHDENNEIELIETAKILFWISVWRQSKTKEEVVIAWTKILSQKGDLSQLNFEYDSYNSKNFDERVDLPAVERIRELLRQKISPEELIMRGFTFEKVSEAMHYGA
tara:strand:- start:11535 stop:11966 length:432 start_codon:yes stop_codon:yes gene_type:complete